MKVIVKVGEVTIEAEGTISASYFDSSIETVVSQAIKAYEAMYPDSEAGNETDTNQI